MTFLHLVDRSRILKRWTNCARARYLEYHAEGGYGIRSKKQSMPLATGQHIHKPIENILRPLIGAGVKDYRPNDPLVRKQVRGIIEDATSSYTKLVHAGGWLDEDEGDSVLRLLEEQLKLVEVATWGYARLKVGALLEEFEIVEVEDETVYVLWCSCGLGDGVGTATEHASRDCNGIGLMLRPDVILKRRSDGAHCNVNFKSGADPEARGQRKKFEENVQFALETIGAEAKIGKPIDFGYVHWINKGKRLRKEYDPATRKYVGPKLQMSPLLYTWFRDANPPFGDRDWKPEGDGRKLKSQGYEQIGFWNTPVVRPDGWTQAEAWVWALDEELVAKQFPILGPLPTPRALVPNLLEGIAADEDKLLNSLLDIYEKKLEVAQREGEEIVPYLETHPEVVSVLNRTFPQSFDCVNFFGKVCQFVDICKPKAPGMVDLLGLGAFELRRPHHDPELEQMKERGLEPPEWQTQEEQEEEEE